MCHMRFYDCDGHKKIHKGLSDRYKNTLFRKASYDRSVSKFLVPNPLTCRL